MERSQSVKNLNIAILNAQGEFPIIDKSANNPFYKSKYAPYDGILREIRPILFKNQLLIEHSVKINNKEINAVVNVKEKSESTQIISIPVISVITRVTHAGSEEWKEVDMDMPAEKGNSHGIQAVITYIKRNNLILLLDIVVGDEDDDGNDSVTPDSDRNYQRPRGNEQRPRQEAPKQEPPAQQQKAPEIPPKHDLEKEVLDTPQQDIKPKVEEPVKSESKPAQKSVAPMTDEQRKRANLVIGEEYDKIKSALIKTKVNPDLWKSWLNKNYGVDTIQLIQRKDYEAIMETIKMNPTAIDPNAKVGG